MDSASGWKSSLGECDKALDIREDPDKLYEYRLRFLNRPSKGFPDVGVMTTNMKKLCSRSHRISKENSACCAQTIRFMQSRTSKHFQSRQPCLTKFMVGRIRKLISTTAKLTGIKKLFASNRSANHNIVGSNGRNVVGVMVETKGERFIVTLSILLERRGHVGGTDPLLWQRLFARDFDSHWMFGIKLFKRYSLSHRQSC